MTSRTKRDEDVVCLKMGFDTHAIEGKITLDQFDHIVKAAGARYLDREMQAYIDEFAPKAEDGRPRYVDWSFCKSMFMKTPLLNSSWGKAQQHDHTMPDMISKDVFLQIIESVLILIDSTGDAGQIDVNDISYLLGSCGEEMDTEEFDEALKIIGHSSKGKFNARTLLRAYGEYGKKVGLFNDEHIANLEKVIAESHWRFEEKRARFLKEKGKTQKVDVDADAPDDPDAAAA